MDVDQLQQWLLEHAENISAFTEFEVQLGTESDLQTNLQDYWFRDPQWNEPGYRFIPLGQDGTGGEVAVWLAPLRPHASPVVFFGSEGGAGVVAASPLDFVRALAYGPAFLEYAGSLTEPSCLSLSENWFLSDDDAEQSGVANAALARYRVATQHRFGELPCFEALSNIPVSMQSEFRAWVVAVQARVSERDTQEQLAAEAQKRRTKRSRAASFVLSSTSRLDASALSLADGARFDGTCASCGVGKTLRMVRFEEFSFGLCSDCYFSNVW